MFKFEELRVYQIALEFNFKVFTITSKWPLQYRHTISNQFQRASLSIGLNIAEGSSRSKKDFQHFLSISRGSCYECIPIISIAKKLSLLTEKEYILLYNDITDISKMLSGLRNSL